MNPIGKRLVIFGVIFIVTGILFQFIGRIPGVGRLPGDIYMRKGPVTFYFPIMTSLIVSLVLSLVLSFFWRK